MKEYKRKTRRLSQKTKDKISRSLSGKAKSESHRKNLSISLTNYWRSVK